MTVISVKHHKTSTGGPARLTLDGDGAEMLEAYFRRINSEGDLPPPASYGGGVNQG